MKSHNEQNPLIDKALKAKRESKSVEFKETFDPHSTQDWCEILKDFVAIANTGGGVIVIGTDSKGVPSGADVSAVIELDPARIADKIRQYTGTDFDDFEIHECKKCSYTVAVITIGSPSLPLVFTRPGTYPLGNKKQRTAFSQGTVYFRHGAKSEPGTNTDLNSALNRRLSEIRKEWLAGVRKVVKAPPGSEVQVLPPEVRVSDKPGSTPIRIVDDPAAPAYRRIDPNATHIYRQMDVIAQVRKRLPQDQRFNSHDVLAIRRVHGIESNPLFFYKPKFGSPQYSQDFVKWILGQHRKDKSFFAKTRRSYRGLP